MRRDRHGPPTGRWLARWLVGRLLLAAAVLPVGRAQPEPSVVDAGGGRSAVANIVSDASVGGIVGLSTSKARGAVNKTGYIGQLYDVRNLAIAATPPVVRPGQTSQLTGTAGLDDSTALALLGSEIAWEPAVYPIESISPNGVAKVASAASQTEGTVTGWYRGGGGSGAIGIDVLFPPVIRVQPLSQTNLVGTTVYFTVVVEANPASTFQWSFGGADIRDATNSVLVLPNVQTSQAGTYRVAVANALGRVLSAPATLDVALCSPEGLADRQLARGGTLVLCAELPGASAFQWRRNGENLPAKQDPMEPGRLSALLAHGGLAVTSHPSGSTLVITNFQPADAGSYSVEILNESGRVETRTALVTLLANALCYSDRASSACTNLTFEGLGVADTSGVANAWFEWTAPDDADGLATFATAGSAFDTVLAVYRDAAGQEPVEIDDDSGGSYTSFLSFNTERGRTYYLAVADRTEQGGPVVLGWQFDGGMGVPVAVHPNEPVSLLVTNRSVAVEFHITLQMTNDARYQWQRNGRPLSNPVHYAGTNQATLKVLRPLGNEDVGLYTVRVTNSLGLGFESRAAILELAEGYVNTNFPSQDKFDDLLRLVRTKPLCPPRGVALHAGGAQSVSAGTIISDNFGARTEAGERPIANTIGGASRWYYLPVCEEGLYTVQAASTNLDCVLAVYSYSATNLATARIANLTLVGEDDNSTPDGTNAVVRFMGKTDRIYFAAMDGHAGADGRVKAGQVVISWTFTKGPPPDEFRWFVCQTNVTGVLTLDTGASGIGQVYLVYTGTDYPHLLDVPFRTDADTGNVSFAVAQDRVYLVLADAANRDPSSIRPVWQVGPLDRLAIAVERPTGQPRRVQLQWVTPGLRLQSASSLAGPWSDLYWPTEDKDGVVTASVLPTARMQLFRLAPPR